MNDNHLAIDDCLAGDVQGGSDRREPFGPVQTVAGLDLLATTVGINLNAVAVIFDFMEPLIAVRCLGFQCGELGLDEPRHGRVGTLGQLLNSQIIAPEGQAGILRTSLESRTI